MSSTTFNILLKQKEQVKCMLNLKCIETNNNNNEENSDEPWKIIIYDEYCRDILTPLFSVQELQSYGITLYLLINSKRQQIPNVPSIYFIQPTQSNLDIISSDMYSILYNKFYLNFSLNLSRPNLEYLANKLIKTNSFHRLTKIYDQYINYISLSPNLFTLNINNCYLKLNSPKISSDKQIEKIIKNIVESLFCAIVTLQTIPIIKCQKGGAAQQIGQLLTNKISNHLKDRNSNLFSISGMSIYQNRPILILLERHVDFAMPLHHSPIYESLIDDLLGLKSNHVNINNDRIFLDYENDEFWQINALEPLPKVHEYHTNILQWYQMRKDEIENNKINIKEEENKEEEKEDNSKQNTHNLLKSTIKSMPELLKKKDEIDRHNKLMTAVSNVLSDRSISEYFHLEESLMHSKILNTQQFNDLNKMLSNKSKGIIEDKLRLFLIYYLCHKDIQKNKLNELINNLLTNDEINENPSSLQYIIEHKKFLNLGESLTNKEEEKKNENNNNRKSSWWETGASLLNQVQAMLPTSGKCTITRIVKLLMNTDSTSAINVAMSSVNQIKHSSNPHLKNINKNYITYDPINTGKNNNFIEYQRCIVFIVGGGCYSEYANLNEFAKEKNKNIIYGSTDIVSPNQFLTQLSELGEK